MNTTDPSLVTELIGSKFGNVPRGGGTPGTVTGPSFAETNIPASVSLATGSPSYAGMNGFNVDTTAPGSVTGQAVTTPALFGVSWKTILTWVLAGAALWLIVKFFRKH